MGEFHKFNKDWNQRRLNKKQKIGNINDGTI